MLFFLKFCRFVCFNCLYCRGCFFLCKSLWAALKIIIIYSTYFWPFSILWCTGCVCVCVCAINWDKAEPQKGESAQFCTVSLSIFSRKSWGSTVIWFHLSKEKKKAHWHYFALMICFVFSLLRFSLWVVAVVILWCGNPTYTGYSFHTHFCILKYLGNNSV